MTPTSASAPQRIERGHIEDLVDEVIGAARGFDKGRKVGRVADATRPPIPNPMQACAARSVSSR
jgi:hypothetical protein